jgi:hypothetical protein
MGLDLALAGTPTLLDPDLRFADVESFQMSPLSLLLRCLLALALVVSGLPTFASSSHGGAADVEVAGSDDAPCHDQAPEPVTAVSDCCDGGGSVCGCDCLQSAPGLVIAGISSGSVLTDPGPPVALAAAAPRSSFVPSLRPPIG